MLGISPFRTGVDLYYDKLGQPVEDDGQNWVALEMGNLLEDLVARIFAKKTGLKVMPIRMMFRHPDHPWMLADLDRLATLPDGSTAILEIKTTNYNARDKWEYDGKPIVPPYYEAQGRQLLRRLPGRGRQLHRHLQSLLYTHPTGTGQQYLTAMCGTAGPMMNVIPWLGGWQNCSYTFNFERERDYPMPQRGSSQ